MSVNQSNAHIESDENQINSLHPIQRVAQKLQARKGKELRDILEQDGDYQEFKKFLLQINGIIRNIPAQHRKVSDNVVIGG